MEYYPATKTDKVVVDTMWMNLKRVLLNENHRMLNQTLNTGWQNQPESTAVTKRKGCGKSSMAKDFKSV